MSQNGGAINHRRFDPDKLEKYRQDDRFQYEQDRPVLPPATDEEDLQRVAEAMADNSSVSVQTEVAWGQIAIWVAVGLLAAFIIWQLSRMNWARSKQNGQAADVPAEEFDLIETPKSRLDLLIEQAVAAGDYRLALRLHYLRVLKSLSNSGMIRWQRDKTNHDYLNEVTSPELNRPFAEITRLFEYVWYGKATVDAGSYPKLQRQFNDFEALTGRKGGIA